MRIHIFYQEQLKKAFYVFQQFQQFYQQNLSFKITFQRFFLIFLQFLSEYDINNNSLLKIYKFITDLYNFISFFCQFQQYQFDKSDSQNSQFFKFKMQQYQLSNLPSRYQLAQHIHSSLDQPNLDNVQAKLYAIRQRNYQMAQQFFEQKYGSSVAYDQYLQKSNMEDLKPSKTPFQEYNDQLNLKEHLAYKALEIKKQEMQKIQQSKQNSGKTTNKRPSSSKNNPWLDNEIKNNIRSQQNRPISSKLNQFPNLCQEKELYNEQGDEVYEKYVDPNVMMQIIDLRKKDAEQEKKGEFLSEFKQYLVNKNKLKKMDNQTQNLNESPKKLNKSLANNSNLAQSKNFMESGNIGLKNQLLNSSSNLNLSSSLKNMQQVSPQQQLVKKIFKNLNSKKSSSPSKASSNIGNQYVQKIQLAQYLTQNQRILDVLNVGPEEIVQKLHKQLETKDPNKVKFHQCLLFVYQLLGKQEQQKKLYAKYCFADIPNGCMLQPQVIKHFQKMFKLLDKSNDLIVKRLQFIQRLALDPMLTKIINTPAVFQPILNKSVSLRRVFERIEVQTLLCQQQDIKAKQYISWSQFMKYFQSGHANRGKYDILRLVQSLKNEEKMGFSDIPQTVYQVITLAIKKLDKGEEYFNTKDLVAEILINKVYQVQKYSFVRGKGNDPKSVNIPMETFQETLTRIKESGPKYITIKEFLQFFSVRGQPIQLIQERIQAKLKGQNQPSKITQVQQKIFGNQSHQILGYDSDPQFYNNSQLADKKQFRKTLANEKSNLLIKNIDKSNYFESNVNLNVANIKVTVPKPFNFQKRQKQRAQRIEKNKLNRSASVTDHGFSQEFKFKAKQIPNKVKQIGLYQKIIQDNIKKIEDRKKCSMLLTLANEQPFSFYNRKAPKKTKEQRQNFQFKANPIPWYCSVNLLKKKQQKQLNRNEKIARMAQQNLSKAKLPPRMEKDFQQKLARKNLESNKIKDRPQSVIKSKQPPNFDYLHKQFEAALQRKRKQNKTTQIRQFNFSQVKRQNRTTKQIQQEQQNLNQIEETSGKQQKWRQTLKSSINVFASSTAKFDQQVQKRRKQMQQKKREQKQRQLEQENRKKINKQLSQKLQQKAKSIKKIDKEVEMKQNKKRLQQQQQTFKNMKTQWLSNAAKQPLLVERPLARDVRIQKMKKLHQISQNLKKNGIKGKQHDQYFKRQELLMLQDYQYLMQKEKQQQKKK